jgi:hypothetical protein
MRKIFLTLLLCTAANCFSSNHFMELSLIYPISTNKTKNDSTNVNLALFQNSLGYVNGFNFCGISAVCKGNVVGVQTSILYSQIDDNLKGISMSTVNVVNDSVKGVQLGIANLLGRSFKGFQSAAIVNFAGGYFSGLQQSTIFNIVGRSFKGVQSAGAGNVVGEDLKGVQLGTTFNFVGKVMRGLQWSGVNVCGELRGLQVGYGNITQKNNGWQIGLLNIAEEQNGIPIGLANISDDGNICWQTYLSNFAGFITAMRFESNNFVSSIEFGGPNLKSDLEESALVGFHYGYRIPIKRFGFEGDFGFFHVMYNLENKDIDVPNNFALQLRFSASYKIRKWLTLFAGFGGTTVGEYEVENDTEDSFLYFVGLNLF